MTNSIIKDDSNIEGEVGGGEGVKIPEKFDEDKYWTNLREEIREFYKKTEDIQTVAKEQFQREIKIAVNNIEGVIDKLEVEYPEMSVFFMRDVGNLFQDFLHDFNPCLYPSSDEFYKDFYLVKVLRDELTLRKYKLNQSHV